MLLEAGLNDTELAGLSETTARGLSLSRQVPAASSSPAEGQDGFSQELKEHATS